MDDTIKVSQLPEASNIGNNDMFMIIQDGSNKQVKADLINKTKIESIDNEIETINSSIRGLSSGSPKGAYDNVSALESANPETGVYIVRSNGHIYSWTKDGTSAVDLGLYQATDIADGSITPKKTTFAVQTGSENLFDYLTAQTIFLTGNTDPAASNYGKFATSSALKSFILNIEPNTLYGIEKTAGQRFRVFTSENRPVNGVTYTNKAVDDAGSKINITSGESDSYLLVVFFSTTLDTITENEMLQSVKVYKGEEWIDGELTIPDLTIKPENTNFANEEGEKIIIPKLNNKFSNLSSEMIKLLSFRALGSLDKGYVCMIADDGSMNLSNYTFGVLKEKNVPCTFALWSTSPIITAGATSINKLKEMINDYGCSVCQHGQAQFDTYTEDGLIEFLDSEAAFWRANNINVEGLVYPNHYRTNTIRAICGAKYNVCCSGPGSSITYNYGTDGARTNIFDLARVSLVSFTDYQNAIDYAVSNNKLLIVYWHDNTLVGSDTYKALFNSFIDYAKDSGITFITLDKVNKL